MLAIAGAFVGVLGYLNYRACVPFATAGQFIDHFHQKRVDEAKAMIVPEDRKKIPDGFWEQIREMDIPRNHGVGYGWISFFVPQIIFIPHYPEGFEADYRFRFTADGTVVRVRGTEFSL